MLSGIVRASSEVSIEFALFIALLITYAGIFFIQGFNLRFQHYHGQVMLPVLGMGLAYFFYCMYSPLFDGLVSSGGGDAADHVFYLYKFSESDPKIYNGFITFHALAYWLKLILDFTDFEAFRFAFYLFGAAFFALLGFILSEGLGKRPPGTTVLSLLAVTAIFVVPLNKLLFPILSYLQADGFYPQLYGILILMSGLLLFALATTPGQKFVSGLLTLIFYRYTYGLNLADLCLALGIIFWIETKSLVKLKVIRAAILLVTAGTSLLLWSKLLPLFLRGGGIPPLSVGPIITGIYLLCAGLLAAYLFDPSLPKLLRRLALYASVFSGIGATLVFALLLTGYQPLYYLYKYNFHGTVLITCISLCIAAFYFSTALEHRSAQRLRRGAVLVRALFFIITALGLYSLKIGYEIVRPHYEERRSLAMPKEILEPVGDPESETLIRGILKTEQKLFGGFVTTPYWVLSGFMNASFRYYHYNSPRLYTTGKLRDEPGRCIFWNWSTQDKALLETKGSKSLFNYLRTISRSPQTKSIVYSRRWSNDPAVLNYHCFEKSS